MLPILPLDTSSKNKKCSGGLYALLRKVKYGQAKAFLLFLVRISPATAIPFLTCYSHSLMTELMAELFNLLKTFSHFYGFL